MLILRRMVEVTEGAIEGKMRGNREKSGRKVSRYKSEARRKRQKSGWKQK